MSGTQVPGHNDGTQPLRIALMSIPAQAPAHASECDRCPLSQSRSHVVWGEGPVPCDLAFLAEAPGAVENRMARPLVGPAGKMMDDLLRRAGVRRRDVYVTNAIKCKLPDNKLARCPEALGTCRPWLEEELAAVRPKVLVIFGATAAIGLLGGLRVGEFSGVGRAVELPWGRVVLVGCYHPSAILRNQDNVEYKRRFLGAVERAKVELGMVE